MHATLDPVTRAAVVLALVQGLSEFLPVSSSGHLVLVPYFFGWADQGLAFDVAVHVGTLFAVVAYFRRELTAMARAWFASLAGGGLTRDARLAWCVILGTIPVGVVGLAFGGLIEEKLRNPVSVRPCSRRLACSCGLPTATGGANATSTASAGRMRS